MKMKIFKNREVLAGRDFEARLNGRYCQFTIMGVDAESMAIYKNISYDDMNRASQDSLEDIVKRTILDNSIKDINLSQRAFNSRTKLKRIPIIIDGNRFEFGQITNSGVRLEFSVSLDELLEIEDDTFTGDIKGFVLDNLMDNPPEIKRRNQYVSDFSVPYLFQNEINTMYFTKVGPTRTVVSKAELERNRERNKELIEKEKITNEKAEKLKKEFNFNKKSNTRDLARFR